MNEVAEYLKSCGTFYLATDEEGQPHIRPFGSACMFDGKLYFCTNNQKKVYFQLKKNAKVELCGMHKDTWIRVEGEVKEDLRREARVAMLEAYPSLEKMYSVDDNRMTVFCFEHGKAVIYSFTSEQKMIEF